MGSGKLNDWLQLVGLLGVLGGLMFVGMQLRQDREIASINSVEDASASMFYWAELVADHPQVWAKGLSGESLSAEESTAFLALARALELSYFAAWNRARRMESEELANRWVREAAFDIHTSPGLLEFWRKHQERMDRIGISGTIGEDWITAIDDQLIRFQSNSSD